MQLNNPNTAEIALPDFTLVSASAGSGKTHALTYRYLQFILSEHIPGNKLRNILAITFTNNAAREMKQRILEELKKASLGDRAVIDQFVQMGLSIDEVRQRAVNTVEYLLDHYSEFQVQTIDSFLSRVFRASALEFGFPPNVEILIDSQGLLRRAFEQFAQELAADTGKRAVLDGLVDMLLTNQEDGGRYLWNPFVKLSEKVLELYNVLSQYAEEIAPDTNLSKRKQELRLEILSTFSSLRELVKSSGLEVSKNFQGVIDAGERKDVDDLIGRQSLYNLPVRKTGVDPTDLNRWKAQFDPLQAKMKQLANEYIVVNVRTYYTAYAEALRYFRSVVGRLSKSEGAITIGDLNRHLAAMIKQESVPEIYFYLGERINHYLIDEFQDTSPLQWDVFRPLAEESLSQKGSLFIVGDTKQSIYTFRGADWQIMRRLMKEEEKFPSAPVHLKELDTNYRSYERIVDFSKEAFHKIVPSVVKNDAPRLSGLSDYSQKVKPEFKGKGYVEVIPIDEDQNGTICRDKMLEILRDCQTRGYSLGEITVLTPRNEDVVEVSGWLNNASIAFISHSNLDIRGRKVTGEILAILRFLDSPVDDLSFATIVLGDIFNTTLAHKSPYATRDELRAFLFDAQRRASRNGSLYRKFRERFPGLWRDYFEDLFNRVGYLPLYDLVSELYKGFELFSLLPDEEAALVKFLEVIKDFEDEGQNSLKDFLAFAGKGDADSDWNIPVPHGTDAVSVMTVHKAKGLGNKVVIVLLHDSVPRPDNLFITHELDGLHLLRINADSAEVDTAFRQLYAEKRIRRAVDDLNKLYVAFTRAKEELYVISVKSKRFEEPSKFLPSSGYEQGRKPTVAKHAPPEERSIRAEHVSFAASLKPVQAEALGLYERKRGDFIHAVLARLEYLGDDVARQIRDASAAVQAEMQEHIDGEAIPDLLNRFLTNKEVRQFFVADGNTRILNEQEFATPEGRLFRMDRIVVDERTVTVIDFKTGGENPEYVEQVRRYMNILTDFFKGRDVKGILAYCDRGFIREVTITP
jgi:ATP-dependent exoDNAse (exonuclease V) beta subunit